MRRAQLILFLLLPLLMMAIMAYANISEWSPKLVSIGDDGKTVIYSLVKLNRRKHVDSLVSQSNFGFVKADVLDSTLTNLYNDGKVYSVIDENTVQVFDASDFSPIGPPIELKTKDKFATDGLSLIHI